MAKTDMPDYAREALAASRIRTVYLVGRRGPAQAKFTTSEIRELGELAGTKVVTLPEEIELDPLSRAEQDAKPSRQVESRMQALEAYLEPRDEGQPKTLYVRFLLSPVELVDDGAGSVTKVKFVRNELYEAGDGSLRSRATDAFQEVDAGLVFRSVGYRGKPVSGVPFREDWGTIPNEQGRILAAPGGEPVLGLYTAGWIKRGPSGVIGTNRPDSLETVAAMLEDAAAGRTFHPVEHDPAAVEALLRSRGVRWVTFGDWKKLDAKEVEAGEASGCPRRKFTSREEIFGTLGR